MSIEKKTVISAAIASVIGVGLALASSPASADKMEMEKCYGVAKAGKNDCGGAGLAHSCQGQGKKAGNPKDWILLPKGTCDKIVGGSTKES